MGNPSTETSLGSYSQCTKKFEEFEGNYCLASVQLSIKNIAFEKQVIILVYD